LKRFRANYHVHTFMSDGSSEPVKYLEKAVESGLTEIGFTDHLIILDDGRVGPGSLDPEKLDEYIDAIRDAASLFKPLSVKCGLEVDYTPGGIRRVEEILASYRHSLDYTLIGVHIVDGFEFDIPESIPIWRSLSQEQVDKVYRRYYQLLLDGVRTGLFDVVAHLDIVKRFGFKPSRSFLDLIEPILLSVKTLRMAVEVSSAGLRHPVNELYPSEEIVTLMSELRVPVTSSTDAHKPEDISTGLEAVVELIKSRRLPFAVPGGGLKVFDSLKVL